MKNIILQTLLDESKLSLKGLYYRTQILFAYNSNHIEGSTLSEYQTRMLYEKNEFLAEREQIIRENDIIEARNHFKAFDFILQSVNETLSKEYFKKLHYLVKQNCQNIKIIGDFKQKPNFIGDSKTTTPSMVNKEIESILKTYKEQNSFEDIVDFHYEFEKIHPFEDGNGRVGRLLMFKECLKNNIIPFIIDEEHKLFYYRGLKEFEKTKGYLIDTCLSCQDRYKEILEYFKIDLMQTANKSVLQNSAKSHLSSESNTTTNKKRRT